MKKTIAVALLLAASSVMAHTNHVHHDAPAKGSEQKIDEVKALIQKARQTADEDYYHQAQTVLAQVEEGTPGAKLYQAEIEQYFHQFDQALVTLTKARPSVGADLLKSSIQYTQGNYEQAYVTCKGLFGKVSHLVSLTCVSQAMSLNGKLSRSYNMLQKMVKRSENAEVLEQHWAYTTLAEMAERRNEIKTAMLFYERALKLKPNDIPSRIAYADLLISQKQYDKAQQITKDYLRNDLLLLRYVRALNIQGDMRMSDHFCDLKRRVLNYEYKKNHLHYDLMAEYYFYFSTDFDTALAYASKHWQQQKTPRDARLLATVALTAGDEDKLQAIHQWRGQRQLEDKLLDNILQYAVLAYNE